MTKREKRLQRMRQNPKNVRYEDIVAVLQDYGFTIREGSGSHVFVDCKIGEQVWTETIVRPHGGKKHVNRTYVRRILQAIDEIIMALEETNDDPKEDEG